MNKIIFLLLAINFSIFANVYENLIGKSTSSLSREFFGCRDNYCKVDERDYFNDKNLDEIISKIELFSDFQKIVYKINLIIKVKDRFKNKDLIEAFLKALKESSASNDTKYKIKEIFDKYGDSIVITIYNQTLKQRYIKQIKNSYLKSLKDK